MCHGQFIPSVIVVTLLQVLLQMQLFPDIMALFSHNSYMHLLLSVPLLWIISSGSFLSLSICPLQMLVCIAVYYFNYLLLLFLAKPYWGSSLFPGMLGAPYLTLVVTFQSAPLLFGWFGQWLTQCNPVALLSLLVSAYLHAYNKYVCLHSDIYVSIHTYRLMDVCACSYTHIYSKYIHRYNMEIHACQIQIYRYSCLPVNMHTYAHIYTHIIHKFQPRNIYILELSIWMIFRFAVFPVFPEFPYFWKWRNSANMVISITLLTILFSFLLCN